MFTGGTIGILTHGHVNHQSHHGPRWAQRSVDSAVFRLHLKLATLHVLRQETNRLVGTRPKDEIPGGSGREGPFEARKG